MKKHIWIIGIIIIIAIVLGLVLSRTSTAPVEGEVAGEVTVGTAVVDEVEIALMESFPLQAMATIRGFLPDGCTTIGDVTQALEGTVIRVSVATERPTDAMCTLALVPYEENIPLDILGIPAGEYTVDVNGATATFTLDQDNAVDFESDKGLVN